MAARRFINSKAGTLPGNRQMQRSVELWIETHREEFDRGVAEWQQRSAQQLVLRFGSYSLPHMRPLEVRPSSQSVSRTEMGLLVSSSAAMLTKSPAKATVLQELLSLKNAPRKASLAHFDALCDPSELPALSTAVPFNVGNSLRWMKLLSQLESMVTDLDDSSATTVPQSVLVTDGASRECVGCRAGVSAPSTLWNKRTVVTAGLRLVMEALSWLFHDRVRPVTINWVDDEAKASAALALADASHQVMQLCA
eukprot:gene19324-22806_t